MLNLFTIMLFRTLNLSYEKINKKSLSKFISEEEIIDNLISKKKFFYLWRQKLHTKISKEKDTIKKIKIIKKKNGTILKVKTIHSFKIYSKSSSIKSSESLNYIFYISNFKIIDMAINEYEPEKYKKMLFCKDCIHKDLKSSIKWQDLNKTFDEIYNNFSSYLKKNIISFPFRTTKIYDSNEAVKYASKYAIKYNSNYKNFHENGGDCTNFVSQCINYGGIPLTNSWRPYTYPWIRVNELYYFLTRNEYAIEVPNLSALNTGDIIQFFSNSKGFFAHSGIVTEILDNGEILYSCHSYDKLNYPLSEIYPILYTKLRLIKLIC